VATVLTRVCIAFLIAFWVLIAVAGALTPDYLPYRDYVSALAGYGSQVAALGILAILCASAAHAAAAVVLMRWDRVVGTCIALASAALFVVAVFRINCPAGAGHCAGASVPGVSAWIHGAAVVLYTACVLVAIVTAGVRSLLGHRHSIVGVPGLVMAVLFVIAFGGFWAPAPGLPQRLWVLFGQVWLVMALIDARHRREWEHERQLLRSAH